MTNAMLLLAQNNDAAAGIAGLGCFLIIGLLSLAALGFWVWMLIDAIQNPRLDSNTRLIWILVIVLTGAIGALIYFVAGRNKSP
jgi:phosphotransferase system  glucose/maltose/N-acetylglucosamine-specific IIC component